MLTAVNLAQAGDAKSVPHARRFARFLEGAGKSTAWCVALLQFDGVLDAEELNAVAAGTRLAANAKAKAAVDKWLEKGLRCAAAETELRMAAPTTAGSTLPLAAMLSQLQTPQGPQGLGALKLTLGGNVDNGSLRAFQHERQTSSGKEQAEDADEEGGRSTRAVRLRRDIVGANTLPLGRRQRKDFVKEVILGPQVERICREFFEHVGPSRLQYKSVADQGDETIFLDAIPQPKVSQAQAEAWQLGGHWRKPSKVSQGATTQVETALAEDTGASETVAATAEETAERRSQVDSSKISTGTRTSRKMKTSTWTRTTTKTLTRMRTQMRTGRRPPSREEATFSAQSESGGTVGRRIRVLFSVVTPVMK